ncbi:MAG: glycosyltransferase family 4 protein [Patescibacteria group bacterium]|nr:glycosyltransferase family 4 protein [Patescibacteria group bacterium]
MKIVFATGIYPPEIGGPAGYVKGVATELTKQGHEVAVITYGDEKTETGENYQVHIARRSSLVLRRYFEYFWQAYKLARKADVVYAQGPVSEGIPSALAAMIARKPFILKIVGDFAWEQYMQSEDAVASPESLDVFLQKNHHNKIRMYEIAERWTAKRAKQIIVASECMRESIARWGVDKAKIKVIYNSIEFNPLKAEVDYRALLNLPKNKKIIITAGRIIYWKRLDIIIRCLTKLNDDYIFVIAGDGPMVESWKRLAQELGVENKIIWLGRIDRELLAKYIKAADVFVIPSCLETFSFVLLEAVQQGCPCVISDRGGMVEIGGMFKELVKIAPFEKNEDWVKDIAKQANIPHQIPVWPKFFSHSFMVTETLEVLQSAHRLNRDSLDSNDSHDYLLYNKTQNQSQTTETPSIVPSPQFLDPSTNEQKQALSISLEKKLFEDSKVRDRIIEQLKDFESTVIVFAKQKFDEQIAPNIRVISTNSWNKFFYVTDALRIVWKLRKQKFAVITSQDPTETGLVAYLASKYLKSALAIQDHGYHFHSNYYRQESWLNQFRYLFARFVVTRADAVRVVSQRTEEALIKLGIAKDKIIRFSLTLDSKFLVSNSSSSSVNSDQWTVTDDAQGSARYEIRDTRYFLVVCRFVPIKRIDLAIHAFSIIAKQNPEVKLKIVGSGPLEEQIKQWTADFDLQGKVEIIPWTDNLAELYRNAIATLIASDREGFGMTAVESLACGTPVIMTDVGCAGEVVKNGENGFIVPVGDVIALANAMEKLVQCQMPNAKCQIIEASGINSTTKSADRGLVTDAKYEIRNTKYDGITGMKVFLLSAISYQLSAKKNLEEEMGRFEEQRESVETEKIKLMLYTPSLDHADPVFGFSVRWAEEFAWQTKKLVIISRFVGEGDVPRGSIGIVVGKPWFSRVIKLWTTAIKYRKQYDKVFVHMSPEVVLAGWPIWFVLRKPIYLWYAHGAIPLALKLAEPLVKLIFASSETGLRLQTPKARFVGQGIDTELFKPDYNAKKENIILTVSRVTPKKKFEDSLEFLAEFKQQYPADTWQYHIIGPTLGCDDYVKNLKTKADALEIGDRFKILPAIEYADLPKIYNKSKLFLSTSQTGSIDKVVLEALACGIPVIARGDGYQNIHGVTNLLDQNNAFQKLHSVLAISTINDKICINVEKLHGLKRLVDIILDHIKK